MTRRFYAWRLRRDAAWARRRAGKRPDWWPDEYDDDGLPYGAGQASQLDPDLWEYGRKSGWW